MKSHACIWYYNLMHNSSCRNIITKPPTQDVEFFDACDFFFVCSFSWRSCKNSTNLDCYLRHSAEQYAKAPTYWVFANFKFGIDYVPVSLQLWALNPAPKSLLTFSGIYDVSMDFYHCLSSWHKANSFYIIFFCSCKVRIWESQSSYQAWHFSFLDAWLMEVGDSALLPSSAFQRRLLAQMNINCNLYSLDDLVYK